jgi:hypothetical protein
VVAEQAPSIADIAVTAVARSSPRRIDTLPTCRGPTPMTAATAAHHIRHRGWFTDSDDRQRTVTHGRQHLRGIKVA